MKPFKKHFLTKLGLIFGGVFLIHACSTDEVGIHTGSDESANVEIRVQPDIDNLGNIDPGTEINFRVAIRQGIENTGKEFKVMREVTSEGVLVNENEDLEEYGRVLDDSLEVEFELSYMVDDEESENDKQIDLEFIVIQGDGSIVSQEISITVKGKGANQGKWNREEINDISHYNDILLGGQDNSNLGGFIDIEGAENHTLSESANYQDVIDFVFLIGASTGLNILVPNSSGFNYFGSTVKDVVADGWDVRNDGKIVNIGNSEKSLEIFENLQNGDQIREAYNTAMTTVEDMPDYDEQLNGPGDRIRKINEGDIIFIKTEAELVVVVKISLLDSSLDTDSEFQIEIKTPNNPLQDDDQSEVELKEFSDISLGGQENTDIGGFYSLENEESYDINEATNNQEKVDFVLLMGKSTGANLLVPSSSGFKYFGSDIEAIVYDGWKTKNTGVILNLRNYKPEGIFDDISTTEELRSLFDKSFKEIANISDYDEQINGPGDRIRKIEEGDIIMIKNNQRKISILKIKQITDGNSGVMTFDMKTE